MLKVNLIQKLIVIENQLIMITGYKWGTDRIENMLWEQGVGSSNLSTPTNNDKGYISVTLFLFRSFG